MTGALNIMNCPLAPAYTMVHHGLCCWVPWVTLLGTILLNRCSNFFSLLGDYGVSHEVKCLAQILISVSTPDCDIVIVAYFALFSIYHIFNFYDITIVEGQLSWII